MKVNLNNYYKDWGCLQKEVVHYKFDREDDYILEMHYNPDGL